jgi:hypothetical protein
MDCFASLAMTNGKPIPYINIHRLAPSLSTSAAGSKKAPEVSLWRCLPRLARRGMIMTREKIYTSLVEAPAMNHIMP